MSWLPPRKIAARTEWSYAHPWLAGCYLGVCIIAFCFIAFALQGNAWFGLSFGVIASVPIGLLAAILTKRRVGERPDADQHPLPTRDRIWSRVSDRLLAGILILGVVVGAGSIVSLTLPSRSLSDLVPAIAGVWGAATAAAERGLRRRST
jgi:hypothetical protein